VLSPAPCSAASMSRNRLERRASEVLLVLMGPT
jgi:hypothetical protein